MRRRVKIFSPSFVIPSGFEPETYRLEIFCSILGPKPDAEKERENISFFEDIPINYRATVYFSSLRGAQFLELLFEFSGACAGCAETPYIKVLTQLFGDRLLVANATGCSSIYGGNLPTTPWSVNKDNKGPAWSNSLFEDNAERLAGVFSQSKYFRINRTGNFFDCSFDCLLDNND